MDTKTCSKCREDLTVSSFYRDTTRKSGLYPQCKACAAKSKKDSDARDPDRASKRRKYVDRYRAKHPDRIKEADRKQNLRRKFGITVEEYDRLLGEQGGVCKICGREPGARLLAVDHCHSSSRVRGLLCSSCNVALGMFADDVTRLRAAIDYLS